ncbi:MAG TPA: PHP domain-containing protein [Candidatus Paceibacterota bacterium]|jgi:predicted metal-dependent phosphoesterase TrpH|nr:PHP domain-containing protein [Candidatus Paceibacterota bacterium]
MIKIDLHVHSYYSDGSDSPEQVLNVAEEEGVKLLSLTDHNFINPESEHLKKNKTNNIDILQGIEISCIDRTSNKSIHMLGYSKSFNIKGINDALISTLDGYNNRAKNIINKLNSEYNCNFDFGKIKSEIKSVFVSRNLIAEKLVGFLGNNISIKEALKKVFIEGEDDSWMIGVEEAIGIIKNNGGKAFLAHPGNLIDKIDFDSFLKRLKDSGLDGIEVYYPKHTPGTVAFLEETSEKFGLVKSAGSDFHGKRYSSFLPGIYVKDDVYHNFLKLF